MTEGVQHVPFGFEHPEDRFQARPDDLLFEDSPAASRPAVVNRWLRELPASGCPSPGSWESYARVLKEWAEFLSEHGVGLFDSRDQLKYALGKYAGYRACLLYTSDAADDLLCVDLGGRRI